MHDEIPLLSELRRLSEKAGGTWCITRRGSAGFYATAHITPQCTDKGGMSVDDAELAVAAVNSLPALLTLAECLWAEVEAWREVRENCTLQLRDRMDEQDDVLYDNLNDARAATDTAHRALSEGQGAVGGGES